MKTSFEPLPIHPIADCWPDAMSGEDWNDFCEDVRVNGLVVAIVIWKGMVVDGRRRQKACLVTGTTPRYEEWDGNGSLASYVASLNFHRRDLDPESKDLVAAKLIPFFEEEARGRQHRGGLASIEAKGRSAEKAAAAAGASRSGTNRAAKVLKAGTPELVKALESRKVSTSKAAKLASLPPREQIKAIEEDGKKVRAAAERDARTERIAAIERKAGQLRKLVDGLGGEADDGVVILEAFNEWVAGLTA